VGHIAPTKVNVQAVNWLENVGGKGMGDVDPLAGHF